MSPVLLVKIVQLLTMLPAVQLVVVVMACVTVGVVSVTLVGVVLLVLKLSLVRLDVQDTVNANMVIVFAQQHGVVITVQSC